MFPFKVIPVDLNVFLYMLESNISTFGKTLLDAQKGDAEELKNIVDKFGSLAQKRNQAITDLMWNYNSNCWNDLYVEGEPSDVEQNLYKSVQVLNQNVHLSNSSFASNYFPLYADIKPRCQPHLVVDSIEKSRMILKYGVAVSTRNTGHQWDQ